VQYFGAALLMTDVVTITGCFFFVGAALPGEPRPHHRAEFDFDEVGHRFFIFSRCAYFYDL
jgi:metal-dependent amidase/aminoacylase/carboxypeptidase family protein